MKYIQPKDHGCQDCQDLFGWDDPKGEMPSILQAAHDALSAEAGAWSRAFHRCRNCKAWWSISYNPKDMMYIQTAAAPQIAWALRDDASLDDAWPFLFAPSPIDEQFENYLYQGQFDPQQALDRLLKKFGDPASTPANQADILRMVTRLLSLQNPLHRALQKRQGWVWKCPHDGDFSQPLLEFERRITLRQNDYRGFEDYATQNMRSLRELLARDANGKRRIFSGGSPELEHTREDWKAIQPSREA